MFARGDDMNKRLVLAQYIGFFTIGVLANIVALLITHIRKDINMNYSQVGFVLSGQFLGMLMTVLIGGFLADRFGKKPFLVVGGVIITIGLAWSMLSGSYMQLLLSCIVTGIGFGAYETGMSALCADTNEDQKGNAMNVVSFFYGLGAVLIPVFVAVCIKFFDNWRLVFGLIAILPVIVTLMLLSLKVEPEKQIKSTATFEPIKTVFIWVVGLSAFTYVGTEVSIYGWLPVIWEKGQLTSYVSASMILTLFWLPLTVGRLFSGRIADKIGLPKYVIYSSLGAFVLALGWWLIPFKNWPLISVILIGFVLAGIFPTIIASITSSFPKNTGMVTAFVLAFGSLGGFLIPLFIGKLADIFGIEVIPVVISLSSLMMLLFTFIAWGYIKKPSIT